MAFNVNRHWLVSRNNYFKWCKGGMGMSYDIVRVFGVPYSFTLKKRDLFKNGEIDANMVQEIMESNVDRILKEVEKDMSANVDVYCGRTDFATVPYYNLCLLNDDDVIEFKCIATLVVKPRPKYGYYVE